MTDMQQSNHLIADLRSQLIGAQKRLTDLAEERKEHVLAAMRGDGKAKAKLEHLTADALKAERSVADLGLAIKQAEQEQRQERYEVAKRIAEKDLADAKEVAAAFLELDGDIDRAFAELTGMLTKRAKLRLALAATECMREAYVNRLAAPGNLTRAIDFHGLSGFIGTDRRNAMKASLVDQDKGLLSALQLPKITIDEDEIDPAPGAPDDEDEEENQAADNAA